MSEQQSLDERLRSLVVKQLDVKPEQVVPEASFTDDLGADSLDIVELVMAMEEQFDVEISDEEAESIQTIGAALAHLREKSSDAGQG